MMCSTWTCISAKCVCCVCVQDGGKALEEAMSHNASVTEFDIRLTEVDEQSASLIMQVVWTNQSLEQREACSEERDQVGCK